jgi:hypothetical protein
MTTQVGEGFVRALAAKDATALRSVLSSDISFRALTPNAFWEGEEADSVIDEILLGKWFEPTDDIRDVVSLDTDSIGTRQRIGYRLLVDNPDGQHLVEQQAYFETDGDRITWLRIVCSGFQPVT